MNEIGFDKDTIVEDFAFALELVRGEVPVWQSQTRVSVLSPHNISAFLRQRTRWYWGIANYLPKAPILSQLVAGSRILIWSIAVTSSWLLIPLWLFGYGMALPTELTLTLSLGSFIYVATIAIGAVRLGGLRGAALMIFVPVYATLEQLVPLYALWTRETDFVVIDK